jgi:hypothetical protein
MVDIGNFTMMESFEMYNRRYQVSLEEMVNHVNENGWDLLDNCEHLDQCGEVGSENISNWCEYCIDYLCNIIVFGD